MVYFKDNEWHIVTEKVLYKQDGEELENFVGQEGKEWWYGVTGVEVVEFTPVDVYSQQLERLDEVNRLNIGDGFGELVGDYVLYDIFPNAIQHPLWDLQILKQQLIQDEYLLDLEFRQSMTEMGA